MNSAKNKKQSYFWTSYTDLMTSLFFVMLVLFAVAMVKNNEDSESLDKLRDSIKEEIELNQNLKSRIEELNKQAEESQKTIEKLTAREVDRNASEKERELLDELKTAISNLTNNMGIKTHYDPITMKYKIAIEVQFGKGKHEINVLSCDTKERLKKIGFLLSSFVVNSRNENVHFLLIIEGQASKNINSKYKYNYKLSYQRAHALAMYWKECGVNFDRNSCEVLICGSGDGVEIPWTHGDRNYDNEENQRFLIHILPKVSSKIQ